MTCYSRLCYTEATIFEIQRLGSIAPQAVPHRTLGDVTGGSKKTQLLVYSQPFCSQRIQDPKGHLCFLDALLHHEVNTSWSFLLLPSGNPYHTLLPSAKENLGIKKANPKRSFSLKMMDLTGSPKSNSQLAIWLIRIRWAKALLSKGDLWSLWETPGCEVQL